MLNNWMNQLKMGCIDTIEQWPKNAPDCWVAFGYDFDSPTPDWVKKAMLR